LQFQTDVKQACNYFILNAPFQYTDLRDGILGKVLPLFDMQPLLILIHLMLKNSDQMLSNLLQNFCQYE
jgi:hypothetical protein